MVGTRLAHYLIQQKIDQGGMGIVYKAKDIRLRRTVAIKILPQELTQHKNALKRFIREAQTASSLNHPNICTIYDIGHSNGVYYIAMEFIEGETLREVLNRRGCLPELEVIEIGLQICDALQAAHSKGIIHRDIKPENIMITQEGLVKVMDFGLAILLNNQNLAQNITNSSGANSAKFSLPSSLSSIQGTVTYMSPEQIEKKTIDFRTDIFALGVVLFEMINGKSPFQGTTFIEIMEAILSAHPPVPKQKAHRVTKDLSSIILKALNKDPKQRFQNASDFSMALKRTKPFQKKISSQRKKANFRPLFIIMFFSLLIIISWLASKNSIRNLAPNSLELFSSMRTVPLTNWAGLEEKPTFSPDGKRIAFHSDRTGNMDVWYQNLVSGEFFNLTENSSFNDEWPCWSPDGNRIAFFSDKDGGGIYSIDLNSREEQKLTSSGIQPSWSPDGNAIAFIANSEKEICILNLNDQKDTTFFKVNNDDFLHFPIWSPDGRWLSFARGTGLRWNIWIKSVVDNQIFQVTNDNYMNKSPQWHQHFDGLFYYSDRSGIKDIWFQKINFAKMNLLGDPSAVTKGAAIASFDISPDGAKIAYATFHEQGNIFALALQNHGIVKKGNLRKITNWNRFTCDPGISPDRTKIVMTSNIQGNYELWLCDRDGKNPRLVHHTDDLNESPVWSPNGKSILFVDGKAAARELKILDLENGNETFLTNNDYADAYPDWSPDGKWIAYSIKDNDCNIWLISPTGGERIQLTDQSTVEIAPHFSPDGKLVSFISDRDGYFNVWAIAISGGSPFQITFNRDQGKINLGHCWSADGKYIYYCRTIRGIRNIWKISLQQGRQEQLTFYTSATENVSRGSRISTDGTELFFATYERTGDIWLMQEQSSQYIEGFLNRKGAETQSAAKE